MVYFGILSKQDNSAFEQGQSFCIFSCSTLDKVNQVQKRDTSWFKWKIMK